MGTASPVAAGQTIANKYLVEDVLGEGGMGVVVAAWHLGLDQRVAIKLLLRERLQHDSSALERFQREARVAARIPSEHVCRVLDTGALDDGTPFLVMEYLEGHDLAVELTQRGRLPVAEAVALLCQACDALHKAHEAGIIHRDLKPANLFLQRRTDGTRILKVLDFGVSKSFGHAGASHRPLTKTASVVGSPIYMSPEQLNSSKDVDGRTDVWALGTILYELISGRTPFFGESMPQLVSSVLHHSPEPFSAYAIMVPAGLEDAMLRALRKARDERYPSAEAFARALAPFAPSAQVSISHTVMVAPRPPALAEEPAPVATGAAPSARPQAETSSSPRAGPRRALLALLALAALGAALWLLAFRGGGREVPHVAESVLPPPSAPDAGREPSANSAPASSDPSAALLAAEDASAALASSDRDLGASAAPTEPASQPRGSAREQNTLVARPVAAPPTASTRGGGTPKRTVEARASTREQNNPAERVEANVSGVTNFGGRH